MFCIPPNRQIVLHDRKRKTTFKIIFMKNCIIDTDIIDIDTDT